MNEPRQELIIHLRLNVKQTPFNHSHQKALLNNLLLTIDGEKIYEEDGKFYYDIGKEIH